MLRNKQLRSYISIILYNFIYYFCLGKKQKIGVYNTNTSAIMVDVYRGRGRLDINK